MDKNHDHDEVFEKIFGLIRELTERVEVLEKAVHIPSPRHHKRRRHHQRRQKGFGVGVFLNNVVFEN